MMRKFQGVFGSRGIGENNKKRGGIEMKNSSRSSVVGVDGSRIKNEEEKNMFGKVKGLFGRKGTDTNTENKEETKMFNKVKEGFINLDSKAYGIAHTVGFMLGVNGAEYKAGYQEAVSKQVEDTSGAKVDTAEPAIEKEEMDMDTFLEKVNTFFDDVKDELNEEVVANEIVVEVKVERAKQVKTEEIEQLKDTLASWGVKDAEDVERKVDAFLHQVVKEDIEKTPPTLALKAGRLTGLLTRKVKKGFAGTGAKIKDYFEDNSLFDIFKDTNKAIAKAIVSFTLPAWVINQLGLTVLAGWVATPAAMVIGLYPIIIAILLLSKASVDSSALVERKAKEDVASNYLNRKED